MTKETLLYYSCEQLVSKAAGKFRLVNVKLGNDGSVYITIFRHANITGILSDTDPVEGSKSKPAPAKETRISVHPGASAVNSFVKAHVKTEDTMDSKVFLSNSLKGHDLFMPIAMVATGMPAPANVINDVQAPAKHLVKYDPMISQLRTMIFVSNSTKSFDQSLLNNSMKYSVLEIGGFNLHTISCLWPYPSTNDGTVMLFGTSAQSGPQSKPINDKSIISLTMQYFIEVNKRLKPYLQKQKMVKYDLIEEYKALPWAYY